MFPERLVHCRPTAGSLTGTGVLHLTPLSATDGATVAVSYLPSPPTRCRAALLLSRCDFLLHAASGVAEFAIYWSPQLHERSVHLQYEHRRQAPAWMRSSGH